MSQRATDFTWKVDQLRDGFMTLKVFKAAHSRGEGSRGDSTPLYMAVLRGSPARMYRVIFVLAETRSQNIVLCAPVDETPVCFAIRLLAHGQD